MGWAAYYITALMDGKTVTFCPRGNSMFPRIKSGQRVTVFPIQDGKVISVGDVVLCRVNGHEYLHLVGSIRGDMYKITNNHGHINGWITRKKIYGKLVSSE